MPIVDGNRRFELRKTFQGARLDKSGGNTALCFMNGPTKYSLKANRRDKVAQVEADIAVVQVHFGVSRSEGLKLSLHLTANAIRKNRAMPEIK